MNIDINMNKRKSLNDINVLQTVKKSNNSSINMKQNSTLLEKYYESTMKKDYQTSPPGSSSSKISLISQNSLQKRESNVF